MTMDMRSYWQRYRTELWFYFGFLSILGIAFFLQSVYADSYDGSTSTPTRYEVINVLVDRVTAAYLWLVLTPFIIWSAERISSLRVPYLFLIITHFVTGLFFTFLHIPIYTSYVYGIHSFIPWMYSSVFERMPDISYLDYIAASMTKVNHVYRLLYYSIIIAIHFAFDYFRKYTERERRAAQLELQLKEAQIRTLHQQLQPHFLFNTLNGISSMMYRSVDTADKMLTYLGDLLRISLERMDVPEVRLKDDIAFIERYLLIEQTRIGDRLTVRTNFSPDTLDALVPCMIIQPLLENAIKHGIAPFAGPGSITATSQRDAERLVLQIEDTGPGLPGPLDQHLINGYGIRNTRERLQLLYGMNQSLTFANKASGGLRVTLSLPFRTPID